MTSRDAILQRVRGELAKGPAVALPPVAEVWPSKGPTPAAMAEQFAQELAAVQGEVIRAATMQDARRQLAELVRPGGLDLHRARWTGRWSATRRPICRRAWSRWAAADWQPQQMAELSASVIERGGSRGRHGLVPGRMSHGPGPAALLPAAGVRGGCPARAVGRAPAGRLGGGRRPRGRSGGAGRVRDRHRSQPDRRHREDISFSASTGQSGWWCCWWDERMRDEG